MSSTYTITSCIVLTIILIGCAEEQPTCTAPYITTGKTCCIDKDNNSVCDEATHTIAKVDCELCPAKFITQKEEVIRYKYVCFNETVVDSPKDCGTRSNAKSFKPTKSQDKEVVVFDAAPACRGKYQAAEIHLTTDPAPQQIIIESKNSPNAAYDTIVDTLGKEDTYLYIGFCTDCSNLIDAKLHTNTAHQIRATLKYTNRTAYSRELVLDPTQEGIYGQKSCS